MSVKDLIAVLQRFPADLSVRLEGATGIVVAAVYRTDETTRPFTRGSSKDVEWQTDGCSYIVLR